MRGRLVLAGLCLTALYASAHAQEHYRLATGDQVEIWTSVDEAMRRTVTIGPDGWLSLPLAGHLQGAGMTLIELETEIKGKLRPFFKDEPDLTLMLVPGTEREQTVYVNGDVATPGAYPYRPGLLVAHGLSMAGGRQRGATAASSDERRVTINGEITRTTAQISQLTAQAARIRAEKIGARTIDAPVATPTDISRETAILTARLEEHAEQARAHQERLAIRRELAETLSEQAKALELQIELAEARLGSISQLVDKGFANGSRQIEIRSEIAELRARRHELEGQIVTARMNVADETETYREILAARAGQLIIDLRDTERQLETAQTTLADNKRVLTLLDTSTPLTDHGQATQTVIRIVRSVNGRPTEFEASELSEVQPGDLIRVSRPDDVVTPQPASATGIDNAQRSPS